MSDNSNTDSHVKIMACIGAVCLQWALLEHILLGWISAIEKMPLEKTYIMFGSTDMRGRLGIAINLATDERLPNSLVGRMRKIRTAINDGLLERRNQAVHGVHADAGIPDAVQLTIARLPMPKRHEVVTITDFHDLTTQIGGLANDASSIMNDIMDWRIRMMENGIKKAESQLAQRDASPILELAKDMKARFKRKGG